MSEHCTNTVRSRLISSQQDGDRVAFPLVEDTGKPVPGADELMAETEAPTEAPAEAPADAAAGAAA